MAQFNHNAHFNRFVGNNTDIYEVVHVSPASAGIPLPTGRSHINKFGHTGTDHNGTATIWDANGTTSVYPYPSSGVASITSSSGDDTGEIVEVQGLDGDYEQVVENIAVGASGSVTFSRIFRARKVSATNVGTITINQGGALAAQILPGNGQTLMAVYTIPAGKTGYLLKFHGNVNKANVEVSYMLFARPFGSAFNLKGMFSTQGGNPITYDYPIALQFEETTDIRIDMRSSSAAGAGAIFDILLVDN